MSEQPTDRTPGRLEDNNGRYRRECNYGEDWFKGPKINGWQPSPEYKLRDERGNIPKPPDDKRHKRAPAKWSEALPDQIQASPYGRTKCAM